MFAAAYWRLGETTGTLAVDQLGGAPGTYLNGAVLGAPGALAGDANTAVTLDGGNDQVNMHDPGSGGSSTSAAPTSPPKPGCAAPASDERTIFGKRAYGTPSPPFWQATVTDDSNHAGQVRVNVFDGAANVQVYGPVNRVDTHARHHVVVVFDRDSGITVWVDESARRRPPSSPAA